MVYTDKEKEQETRRTYREKNKEKQNKQSLEWYYKNKDSYNEQRRERLTCEICNKEFSKNHLAEHRNTKFHRDAVRKINKYKSLNILSTINE